VTRVGVVGLGAMGGPMAGHAISAGLNVCVHNRTRDREEPYAARGATRADSPAEVAIGADLVLTCVSDVPDLEQVVLGDGGIIETIQPGAVVVDCSTVSPTISRTIDRALRNRGARFLDCPVSGGPEGAQRGTLTVFVGGEPGDLEKARPLLESFGKTIAYMGPVGAGQAAKAVNQIFLAGAYAGLGEALVFAEVAGLPLDRLVEALQGGAADSWVIRNRSQNVITGAYPPGFRLWMHLKDIRIALAEASSLGVDLPVTELVAELEDRVVEAGYGNDDVSAYARVPRGQV
jgi:3-hydroxyisobutyrate dehydrogenase-like beta-hydroxyacid dehydrogenase